MAPRVEHELHRRRRSRNVGVLVVLLAFVVLILALTVVKISEGDGMKGFDHRIQDLDPPVTTAPIVVPEAAIPEAEEGQQ